ncbi:MAG: hypothetical protein V3T73_04120 [Dehalococcoidales bacterium]
MKQLWWLIVGVVGLVAVLVLLFVSRAQYNDLQADLDAAQAQNTSLSGQLQQAQSDMSSLQGDLNQLQDDYDDVSQELSGLKDAPPARYFSSVSELERWLLTNPISNEPWANNWPEMYDKALRLQQAAADDGYIISVQYHYCEEAGDLEYIACTAYINGFLWIWLPEYYVVYSDAIFGIYGIY